MINLFKSFVNIDVKLSKDAKHKTEVEARPDLRIIETNAFSKKPDFDVFYSNISGFDTTINKAVFEKGIVDRDSYKYIDFTFQNIGDIVINELYIAVDNPRCNFIIEYEKISFVVENGILNYYVMLDKRVFPNDIFTLRVHYHPTISKFNLLSASTVIVYRDANSKYWEQPLFLMERKLYEPHKTTLKDFKKSVDVETAIKCFENPMLW